MTTSSRTLLLIGAVLSGSLAAYGCEKTPTEARTDGVEAQREADEKIAKANERADDKMAEANREGAAATDEAHKTAAEAQATANDKIREANRVVTGKADDSRGWAQKEVDSLDHLIDVASVKAQTAKPDAKAHFNTEIKAIKQQRDALNTEVATLEKRTGDDLDKSKEQFMERVDRVKDDIKNVEKSL